MSFLQLAGLELVLLSILSGLTGTVIVLRKQAFFAVALSHATFPGGVIAALLGINVLIGQAVAAAILAVLLALLSRVQRQGSGAATGLILVFGFALGAVLTALQTGYSVPVEALLIGSLLGVQVSDTLAAVFVLLLVLILFGCGSRQLLFATFDRRGFQAAGFNPMVPEIITTVLVAATIVVAMPAVGAILAVALVVGPAATAQLLVSNLRYLPVVAICVALLGSGLGLWLSASFSVAAGGAIGLVLAALFLLALLLRQIKQKFRSAQ